jgi:hypothetical protein
MKKSFSKLLAVILLVTGCLLPVAADTGSSTAVSINVNGVSVASAAGSLTITMPSGVVCTIQAGMVTITPPGGAPVPLATAAASNPDLAGILSAAVTAVCKAIQNNSGGLSPDSMTSLALQLVGVASFVSPDQAAAFAAQTVAAIVSPNSMTAGNATATNNAIASVVAAAVTAAPQNAAQIAGAAAAAAPAYGSVVAAAASLALPASSPAIFRSVARATNQTISAVRQGADAVSSQLTPVVQHAVQVVKSLLTQAPRPPSVKPPPMTPPVPIDISIVSPSS